MNAATLQAKTEVAAASAQALLERGDPDGTVNRAYDAMFDAARVQFISAAQTHCFALMHQRSHAQLVRIWRQARPTWRARR